MKPLPYIFAAMLFMPLAVSAVNTDIAIGQVQAGGATADDEFVEILNNSAADIPIGTWSIQYKSSSGTKYYKKNFLSGAIISANGRYIVAGSGYAGAYDMKHSSFSLSSAGGTVYIVSDQALITDDADTDIIAVKTYGQTEPPPANTNTNVNTPVADTNTNSNTNTNTNQPVTDSTPIAKTPDSFAIVINEFMPAPADGDEWIELYNGTGYAVDLAGWTIADGTGKSIATLSDLILPTQYSLVRLSSSRLNNSGDLIILRDNNGKEVDSVAYGDWDNAETNAPADDGTATARIADGRDTNTDHSDFALTAAPTPGTPNSISAVANDESISSAVPAKTGIRKNNATSTTDLKWLTDLLSKQSDEIAKLLKAENIIIINNLYIGSDANYKNDEKPATTTPTKSVAAAKNTTTKTAAKAPDTAEGTVIVPAGIVGKDICVVREENRSVEFRLPKDLTEYPAVGDVVYASGSWSTAKTLTLPRLLIKTKSAMSILGSVVPPAPLEVAMAETDEHLGEVVTVTGTIVEKQPTRLRLADSGRSLLIKTNFEAKRDDKLSATGLLVKDGNDLRLTPTSPDALSIIKPPPAPKPTLVQKALPYGIAALPAMILSAAAWYGRRLKKQNEKKGGDCR